MIITYGFVGIIQIIMGCINMEIMIAYSDHAPCVIITGT